MPGLLRRTLGLLIVAAGAFHAAAALVLHTLGS